MTTMHYDLNIMLVPYIWVSNDFYPSRSVAYFSTEYFECFQCVKSVHNEMYAKTRYTVKKLIHKLTFDYILISFLFFVMNYKTFATPHHDNNVLRHTHHDSITCSPCFGDDCGVYLLYV